MFKTCPDPIDVQDLQFKLHCRLKVFSNKELDTFPKLYNLISCASRYGLLFVGSHTSNLQVIQLKCVENYSPKDKDISNYPRRSVPLLSSPQHISVNCDSTILAVVTERDNCPVVTFYDVLSFLKQNVSLIKEVRLSSTPGTYVKEVGWNPALPPIFTACKSDGTLGVYEIKGTSVSINELPAASEATCFCWSPKGKQIAVGSKNCRITQYKPDLKAVKVINQPPLEGNQSIISLQWVSNYQFIGIYQSMDPEGSAKLIVVDAPKTGDPVYTNYEDVCYSGSSRLPQFYTILQQHWNILLVASSNSTELGILGSTGEIWTQWIISDSARAELPLSTDHQETLPLGLALDISSTRPLPWNESSIPPCPYLVILSHHGILCLFSVINLKAGVPSICTPPDPVSDLSGIQQFITPSETAEEPLKTTITTPATVQSLPSTQASVFGAKVLTQPQPTYAAPVTLFGAKPPESKPLFGGQAVLTPIKPQQPTSQPLFGNQTFIMPISKQQTSATSVVKPAEKYSAIFSALNTPASVPPPAESKSIVIPVQNLSKPAVLAEPQVVVQPKVTTTPVKPAEPPKSEVNLKIKEETEVLLAQMLKDECISLESELKALLHQSRLVRVDIGSEQEKVDLVKKIESLQEFIKEIVDISIGENAEVHYLKQNLIQSWAWFEEARSRYNASKDETVSLLLRSQPLDSATEKKQADIRKMMYYIESQITQASKALDEQWDNFQDYAKKVHRTKMPTMETIFQAMVRQNVVLQKQTYILKDIASRLKTKGHVPSIPSLLLSIENTKDLEDSLNRLKIEHPQDIYQMQYERVLNRKKNFSEAKMRKLRNLLKSREVLHVTVVKPQLSSSLMLQSPESKSKRLLSNLAALGTPVTPITASLPKALSFVHSTPIRETKSNIKPTETPPNTPQLEAKTFTFKKVEKSNLPSTNSFIPLSKSASVFSNLPQDGLTQAPLATHTPSAFVPTQVNFGGAGSKLFNFSSAVTTTTSTTAKTVAVSTPTATTAVTFSFGAASSALPKFGASVTPKTSDSAVTTSSVKSGLPQFSFGSGLSITPVSLSKKEIPVAVPITTTGFAARVSVKPSFNFGDSSNIFGAKVASSQATLTTTTSNLFSNLSQASKPLVTTTTVPSSSITLGVVPTSKFSAFSAVTTSASNLTPPATATNLSTKKEDSSLPKSITDSGLAKTVTTLSNLPEPATTSVKPILNIPSFVSSKPSSTTNNSALVADTITSLPVVTTTSIFGGPIVTTKPFSTGQTASSTVEVASTVTPTTIKQSFSFGSASIATPVNSVSSGTSGLTITTVSSTKPSLSIVPAPSLGVSSQSIFGGAQSVASATPTTSVFSSTTKSSIFGAATTTTQSVFVTPSTASQPSIFGSSSSQVQIGEVSQSQPASASTSNTSIFGPSGATSSNQPLPPGTTVTSAQLSIFGAGSSVGTTTQSSSIFVLGKTTSNQSIFGSTTTSTQPSFFGGTQISGVATTTQTTSTSQAPVFGGTTSEPSIFATSTTPKTTATSIFGSAATATTQPSLFGSAGTTTTQPSLFGSAAATTTQPSLFGSTATTTTQPSVFGTTSAVKPSGFGTTSPSNQPLFGTSTVTSTQPSSIFGGSSSPGSIFGSTATTPPAQTSIFGSVKPATTTNSSIFGAAQASTTQSSIFAASTTPSTQTSMFGTPSTTATSPFSGFGSTSTLPSPFGQATSVFGAPKTTASTFGSGFGSPTGFGTAPSTTSSIFGQPSSFGSTTSPVFGTPTTANNIFGSSTSTFGTNSSANVFGSAAAPSSSFSFAGAAGSSGGTGAFGFGGLNVGTPPTTSTAFGSAPAFGQTTAANPFSRPAEQKSPFGGGSSSIFGSPASSSSNVFGSNTGSTFSSNTQGGFGSSSFGSPSTFGQQSTFGQTAFGNTSFGSAQPGPFSGGAGAVAQTGFGSPQSFAKPSGFGASPVFGGSPQSSFGAAPSFGGAPAFGAAPAFGSPNKIFGGNTPTSGFGSSATTNTGFGSLANQNTVGFGSLAQQASSQNAAPFSGSSSFSSWR